MSSDDEVDLANYDHSFQKYQNTAHFMQPYNPRAEANENVNHGCMKAKKRKRRTRLEMLS